MRPAIIVDSFSTGKLLAPVFRARGVESVAVLTQAAENHYSGGSFQPGDFSTTLIARPETPARVLAQHLRELDPLCIVPGCESGVELADQLCELIGLLPNEPAFSPSRRDKLEMQKRLGREGLRSIAQASVSTPAGALAWARARSLGKAVVKPLRSARSDNVWLCRTVGEMSERVQQVLDARTILGEVNACALVQEYLDGVEYVIDAVSRDGVPVVTNACRYRKDAGSGAFLYREVHVLPPDAPEVQPLLSYHARMLRALGIRFGASHAEIMWTSAGPVLVECGARLHGGVTVPELVRRCCGRSQVEALVDSYLDPGGFIQGCYHPPAFSQYAAVFVLANARAGVVASLDGLAIPRLRSRATVHCNVRVGDRVRQTVDLYTAPAWIALEAALPAHLEEDIATLRALEAENQLVTVSSVF